MTNQSEHEQTTVGADDAPTEGAADAAAPVEDDAPGWAGAGAPDEGEEPESAPAPEPEDELTLTARQRDEYLALAQRTKADFENYRKRMARDVSAAEARGVGRTVQQLLGAFDNVEIAVRNLEPTDQEGDPARALALARDELLGGLTRCGVQHYWPEGELFDPTLHEAVGQQAADGLASGTIVSVYQRGYRVDGTVLRPARVVVAS